MTFLHPLALLGLAAVAIPALLHLLQRRVPPEIEFPPLRYLSEAERQSARRLKLRHLVLLVLRTALIVAIVLAAARPLVPARALKDSLGVVGGAHRPTALAVILDNSPSAGAVADGRPVMDRLRVAARTSLARATAADRVWLVLADGVARAGSREALLAVLDGVTPDSRRLDVTRAVERAARLVGAEPLAAREVHVLSDLQRTALGIGAADVPRGVRVLALGTSGRAPLNRGLGAARVTEGAVAVTVTGTAGAAPSPVSLRIGGRSGARVLAAPGSAVSLLLPPLPPGWWAGDVALEPDELRADDQRAIAWRVAPPARVAVSPDAGPFLAAALAVLREARRVGTGSEVTVADHPVAGPLVILPPTDPALLGPTNRALGARGVAWRFGALGTPGPLASRELAMLAGARVTRRYRLEAPTGAGGDVLATVNGAPWLVRAGDAVLVGSRLDTAWTALATAPGFVSFVDALVNRVARGEAAIADGEGSPRVAFDVHGADTVGATVYGLDPRESDLTPATPDELRRALRAEVYDDAAFAAARFAGTRAVDVSGLLLLLALLLAALELGVATLMT
ncbi:MAG: BatA domain-containing protein [Gemmatimonadetes bacterium]|nr:BatA domain-containing protein [Gemmatimonadota bacterium]